MRCVPATCRAGQSPRERISHASLHARDRMQQISSALMPAAPGAHRSLLRAPRLDEHRKARPLRDNLGHAKEPSFIGTASGTTSTCIQIGSIGSKTFYRYGKTFYHCNVLCILRDIILAFMQQAWLVCDLIKRKDCRPGSPQRLHISRPRQASFGFCVMRQANERLLPPLR